MKTCFFANFRMYDATAAFQFHTLSIANSFCYSCSKYYTVHIYFLLSKSFSLFQTQFELQYFVYVNLLKLFSLDGRKMSFCFIVINQGCRWSLFLVFIIYTNVFSIQMFFRYHTYTVFKIFIRVRFLRLGSCLLQKYATESRAYSKFLYKIHEH